MANPKASLWLRHLELLRQSRPWLQRPSPLWCHPQRHMLLANQWLVVVGWCRQVPSPLPSRALNWNDLEGSLKSVMCMVVSSRTWRQSLTLPWMRCPSHKQIVTLLPWMRCPSHRQNVMLLPWMRCPSRPSQHPLEEWRTRLLCWIVLAVEFCRSID